MRNAADIAGQLQRWRLAKPSLMLIVVTMLWGVSFPLMKDWQDATSRHPLGPTLAALTLIAIRMVLALAILAMASPRAFRMVDRRELRVGILLGTVFFSGFALQVIGLAWTTPALSAFITSLGSAWVPLLAWLLFRTRLRCVTLLGMAIGLSGTVILGMSHVKGVRFGPGEWLTVAASWIFAGQIILLDRLGQTVRPARLTVPFFAAASVCAFALAYIVAFSTTGLDTWLTWAAAMFRESRILFDILLLSLFSTVLAFHWMNVYQPLVGANRAALIYLLEPVFGTMFSIALGMEPLTAPLALGGGLILVGNMLVEAPNWIGARFQRAAAR